MSRPLLTGNRDKMGSVYHRHAVKSLFGPIRDLRPLLTGNRETRWVLYITDMMLESLFGPIRDLQAWILTGNRDKGMSRPLLTGNRDKVGSVYHRYDVRVFVWSIKVSRPLLTGNKRQEWVLYITDMMLESLFGQSGSQACTHWKQRQDMMLESLFGPIRDLQAVLTGNRDKVGSVYHIYDVRVFCLVQSGISRPVFTGNRDRWVLYIIYDVRVFVCPIRDLKPLLTGNRDKVGSVYHRYDVRVFVWSNQGSPGLYSLENRDKVGSVYHRYDVRVFVWSNQGSLGLYSLETETRDLKASIHWKQRQGGFCISDMMLESLFGPIRDLQACTHWETEKVGSVYHRYDVRVFVWSNQGSPGLYHWKQEQDGKFMPCNPDEDLSIEATMSSFPPEKVIPRNVALQDFEKSVQSHGRTVTEVELKRFDDFTTSFGESG
ncbi:unnamed protein product [Mytilus edulis]|uniref:Spastin/Vps4 C-terminal domain-containing protein n=1 Tax=Mytilus edulis TaxID=6550 RepID=A0A8S3Q6F1_MYTED|nr:unnamed protein product [Mytilus edulis]